MNEVAVEALARALGVRDEPVRFRDLRDIAGTWVEDPELEEVLDEQRRVDPDLWR